MEDGEWTHGQASPGEEGGVQIHLLDLARVSDHWDPAGGSSCSACSSTVQGSAAHHLTGPSNLAC